MPRPITLQRQIRDSLRTLRELCLPFRGPFVTPQENCVYVVDRRILTANEVVALGKQATCSGGTEPALPICTERGSVKPGRFPQ